MPRSKPKAASKLAGRRPARSWKFAWKMRDLDFQHRKSVRALLHHQTRRVGNRAGSEPADCRSPRRQPDAGKPEAGNRLRGTTATAAELRTWRQFGIDSFLKCIIVLIHLNNLA